MLKSIDYANHSKFLKKFFIFFLATSLFISQLILSSKPTNAAFRGLIIDVLKVDLGTVEKGTSIKKSFTVTHDFEDPNKSVTIYLRAADFTSDNVSGTPKFLNPASLSPQSSLASWFQFEKDVITLNKFGQVETINYTINIPANAEPGGKYAAILLGDKEGENIYNNLTQEQIQLGLSKELGPLIFLSVNGNISRELASEDIYTTDINNKKAGFFFNPPVNVVSKLKNTGNTHVIPKGTLYIYKGNDYQKFIAKFELNKENGLILPNSSREFTFNWNDSFIKYIKERDENGNETVSTQYDWDNLSKLRLGNYKVKLIFTYQDTNNQLMSYEANTSFWVFPWQIIVLILIILMLIIFFIYRRIRKKSKREKIHAGEYKYRKV